MSNNETVVREHFLPLVFQDKNTSKACVFVEYEKINDAEYSFISRPDQDTEIRILPNTNGPGQEEVPADAVNAEADTGISAQPRPFTDDVIDAAYEEYISETESQYYDAAIACGLLCGALKEAPSVFSGFIFDEIESFGSFDQHEQSDDNTSDIEEDKKAGKQAGAKKAAKGDRYKNLLKDMVIFAAQMDGFKGKAYKNALKYLVSTEDPRAESQLHDIFADILEGEVELSARPSVSGLLFSLLSQFSGMLYYTDDKGDLWEHPVPDHYVIGDSREDKILVGIMYWFFHASVVSARLDQYALKDNKIPGPFRSLLNDIITLCNSYGVPGGFEEAEIRYSGWLGKLAVRDREDDVEGMELFFLLREKMNRLCRDTFPAVLNNCLVRAAFIMCGIRSETEKLSAPSLMDILAIDPDKILPRNHRILSNMCLLSAGAFAAVNIGHAALNVLFESKDKPQDKKINDYISRVNIGGIGNFVIAFAENIRNAGENIEVFLNSARWTRYRNMAVPGNHENGECFFFEQEIREILDEIVLDPVQMRFMYSLQNLLVEYDISDTEEENQIRLKKQWLNEWRQIVGAAVQESADSWLITEEKVLFEELNKLSCEPENRAWIYLLILELKVFTPYSGLGTGSDEDYKSLKSNTDYVKDTLIRMQTVASPEEADQMKKLYEKYRALMNSISRKGKNDASTAIIAAEDGGGPALAMITFMLSTVEGFRDEQYAKLLVYGRYILRGRMGDEDSYRILRSRVSALHQQVENQLRDMKEEKNSLDRETISLTGSFLKYLRRLDSEMQKK